MSTNPLVAEAGDTSWKEGLGVVSTGVDVADAIGRGDWVEAAVNGVLGGLETLGAIANPIATLISMGVGWLMEHVEPLKGWLDDLAGDPGQIKAFGETWENVSDRIHSCAQEFRTLASSTAGDWKGLSAEAYRGAATVQAEIIDGFGDMTMGVAGAVHMAGGLVAGVRGIVRDAIADLVGIAGQMLFELLSVVLAPKAIATFSTKVAEWTGKVSKFVDGLLKSMGKFGDLLRQLFKLLEDAGSEVSKVAKKWDELPMNQGFGLENGPGGITMNVPTVSNIKWEGFKGGVGAATGADDAEEGAAAGGG